MITNMNSVSVFGLGYVGCVAVACLAKRGCRVIGVDPYQQKVESINAGRAPFHEPGLDALLQTGLEAGLVRATTDAGEAVANSDISIICVGTPGDEAGALDLRYVEAVTKEIAAEIERQGKQHHRLIYRSTMLPGSTRRITDDHLAKLMSAGRVEAFFYPEFLRQGSAVEDYDEPSLSVVGVVGEGGELPPEMAVLFETGTAVVSLETAELLKYACNAFHASKVSFANEIGRIGKALGIDSREVMDLLVRDRRLNISPNYLKPGNPFGGSCLPKDVSALAILAKRLGVRVPTLDSLIPSNDLHREHLRELVSASGHTEVIFVGFAFKDHTDDLRGSSLLPLAADLLADGREVRIYDPLLDPGKMVGSSLAAVERILPSLRDLMVPDLAEALGERGVVLASNKSVPTEELRGALGGAHHVIDVTGWPGIEGPETGYEGICW
jgi:GDP-mannose 6-dehydrogenase